MRPRHLLLLLLALPAVLAAQSESELIALGDAAREAARTAKLGALDPKRIINESGSFLKEREPEMTAEEYALYEKMLGMLGSNPALALRLLEGMVKEADKTSPAFAFILGNAYYAGGDYAKTESSYKAAVERFPTFLRAWKNLGILYYTTARFPEAREAFARSVALGDHEPSTFGLLGYCLEKEGNYISAEVAYMQALSGEPGNADWQEGLLRLCVLGGQLVRAESIARTLIKAHPTEARFWLILGNVLVTENRKLEALSVLELAAGTGVADTDELLLLGDLYAEQGLHAEALAIYTRLLKLVPETGEQRLLRLAEVLVATGKNSDAENVLRALPAKLTADGHAKRLLLQGRIASAARRWTEAAGDFEAVLADQPLNGMALLSLGRVRVGEGDDARALEAFEAAGRQPDSALPAALELANLELRGHHYARTVEHLEAALKLQRTGAIQDYLDRVKTLLPDETPESP